MTGLDKIIQEITDEASSKAASRLKKAQKKADAYRQEQMALAKQEGEKIREEARTQAAHTVERMQSGADLKKRTLLLAARQDAISAVLDKAYEQLAGQEPEAYFDMICSIARQHIRKQPGILYFSEKDLARMPEDLPARLKETAEAMGGSLSVAKEPADIDSGFVLSYDGIEENCSLKALFREKRELLQDQVNEVLFS